MSANRTTVNLTKRGVERQFHKYWNCQFDIELCESVIYVHNDLHLKVGIPYASVSEKSEIYDLLALLPIRFDFSHTLEFYSLASLRQWHEAYDTCQKKSCKAS